MISKLVVIINSLKVPKIKKILLYEMKFLVPNYRCLQNPWLGGYRPQIPVLSVLWHQLNLLNPPPQKKNKFPGYAIGAIAMYAVPSVSRERWVRISGGWRCNSLSFGSGTFAKLRQGTINFVMTARPHGTRRSVHTGRSYMELDIYRKSVERIQVSL